MTELLEANPRVTTGREAMWQQWNLTRQEGSLFDVSMYER
jgi:hypothetical protein